MSDSVSEASSQYFSGELRGVVPEGYKQTDVGVIPEDWAMETLGSHATFRTGPFGSALHKSDYVDGGVPVVNPMQIVDGKIVPTFTMAISESAAANLSEFRLSAGDIVIGRRGEMGRCTVVTSIEDGWLCGTGSMIIRVKKSSDADFLQRVLSSSTVVNAIENASVGTTMINLNQSTLRDLSIALPCCKKEQTAIANALSDIDALINEQEKLIAKKQAIKTATMQQLLTGRTRLPQFALREDGSVKGYKQSELGEVPEDWEVSGLGELFEASIARKLLKKNELVTFVGMQDVSEKAQLVRQVAIPYATVKSGFTYFEKGDVLVAKITPCFENGKGFHSESINTNVGFGSTEFHVLRATAKADSKFLFFWTVRDSLRVALESEMVGSAGHRRVPLGAFQTYLIPCPAAKEEQTAIAKVITDMDEDIKSSQGHLNKTRQLKQGMMQELLTGKTRLVKPEQSQ